MHFTYIVYPVFVPSLSLGPLRCSLLYIYIYIYKDNRNIKTVKMCEENNNVDEDDPNGLASLTIHLLKDELNARGLKI